MCDSYIFASQKKKEKEKEKNARYVVSHKSVIGMKGENLIQFNKCLSVWVLSHSYDLFLEVIDGGSTIVRGSAK